MWSSREEEETLKVDYSGLLPVFQAVHPKQMNLEHSVCSLNKSLVGVKHKIGRASCRERV